MNWCTDDMCVARYSKCKHICRKDINDFFHSEDGPAVEYEDGYKTYYYHGEIHREDGPALIGDKHAWFIYGILIE